MCKWSINKQQNYSYMYINNHIICSFHLESLVRLVKRLTCDFEIETLSVNKATTIQPHPLLELFYIIT